jgi:putative ABC transport system permease protein
LSATIIPIPNLIISFIPVLFVFFVFVKWKLEWKELLYASIRMISQLVLIGYLLSYIFNQNNPTWTVLIIIFMLAVSAWISLYSVKNVRKQRLKIALISLLVGALPVLVLVTTLVIPNPVWYEPSFLIPIAGMIFSHAMNAIGIAAERFQSERKQTDFVTAKRKSLKAALIPQINAFMAVGLVSLPGMMTGQILSGVSPLIAVRYQMVVMTMILGAGGLSAAFYLWQQKNN